MKLDQIIVRPEEETVLIQYSDDLGRSGRIVAEVGAIPSAAALVAAAQARVPLEADRPDRPEIEKEIDQLEAQLELLRKSIGLP
jgi:hypothetical protein